MQKILLIIFLFYTGSIQANSIKSQTFCSENNTQACLRLELGKTNQLLFLNPFQSPLILSYQIQCSQNKKTPHLYGENIIHKIGINKLTEIPLTKNEIKKCSFDFGWQFGELNPKMKNYLYQLPYPEGETRAIIQGYNENYSHQPPNQYAVDFDLEAGDLVVAAREGRVAQVISHYKECSTDPKFKNRANLVEIVHEDGTIGKYVHFKQNGIKVTAGDKIKKGQYLGLVGCTGYASKAHLHFEVTKPINGFNSQSIPIQFQTQDGIKNNHQTGLKYTSTTNSN